MYSLRRKRKERASDDKGPKRGRTETKGAPALHIPLLMWKNGGSECEREEKL